MLYTNLNHIECREEYVKVINKYENVAVICGRMDPASIKVYSAAEELAKDYRHIMFFDVEFDNPFTKFLLNLPEVKNFSGIPFIIYFKNGNVVRATRNHNTKTQIAAMLDNAFGTQITHKENW
jgi:thioredoxin 1